MHVKLVVVLAVVFASSVLSEPPPDLPAAPAQVQSSGSSVSVSNSQEGPHTFSSGFAAATGSDGKTYYVKDVNGHIEKGVLEGPMPTMDLSPVFANAFPPQFPFFPAYVYRPAANNAAELNFAIRQSVNQYLQNLRI